MLYDFRGTDILKHPVKFKEVQYAFHCLPDNQFSQKSWDRRHKTIKFQQTSIPPDPCSMFCPIFRQVWCVLVVATLIGVGGGGEERYCV
jgi:hypothetical protein